MAIAPQPASTLNFRTIKGGSPITIDGRSHSIRHPEALPLADYKTLETTLPRLGHLMVKAKLATAAAAEASLLLADVIDVILDAPEDVRAKLTDVQRVLILDVFMKLRPSGTLAPRTEASKGRRRTGAKSSRR